MLTDAEKFQEQALVAEMDRDRRYWAEIERQKGGEVHYHWHGGKVRVGADWSRRLGYAVMEGLPVVRSRA